MLDMVRSMMGKADLPKSFWGYVLQTTAYILNRVPSKSVEVTPYEIWTNKKPYLSYMKVWGCPAYVKLTISYKLEARFDKCLFVGYPKETRGYQFYNTLEQRLLVSKHVVFLEKEFLLREDSEIKVELSEVQDALTYAFHLTEPEAVIHDDELIADSSKTQVLHRTSRIRSVPERNEFLISEQNDVLLVENDESTTYEKSLNSLESDQWLKAMKSKMDSMYTNQVWTLVDPPEGLKPIG